MTGHASTSNGVRLVMHVSDSSRTSNGPTGRVTGSAASRYASYDISIGSPRISRPHMDVRTFNLARIAEGRASEPD